MKRKFVRVIIVLCILFSACGNTEDSLNNPTLLETESENERLDVEEKLEIEAGSAEAEAEDEKHFYDHNGTLIPTHSGCEHEFNEEGNPVSGLGLSEEHPDSSIIEYYEYDDNRNLRHYVFIQEIREFHTYYDEYGNILEETVNELP